MVEGMDKYILYHKMVERWKFYLIIYDAFPKQAHNTESMLKSDDWQYCNFIFRQFIFPCRHLRLG